MTKTLARLMMMHDQRNINSSTNIKLEEENNYYKSKDDSMNTDGNYYTLQSNTMIEKESTAFTSSQMNSMHPKEAASGHSSINNLHNSQNEFSIKQESTETIQSKVMINLPPTELIRENSNMIQIYSSDYSIWKGCVWSKIKFKITLDKYFLPNQDESNEYVLAAFIECTNIGTLINPSSCIGTKIEFERNGLQDSCNAVIDRNPYNSVELTIHQDFFNAGETFHLIVKALKLKPDPFDQFEPTYFGRSQNIIATNYAISLDHQFDNNPYIVKAEGEEYAWYNKCGGDSSGLDVMIHLRDEKGKIVNNMSETIYLRTELVYSDGTLAPYMPLCPLKKRLTNLPLYRPLEPEPTLTPGNGSTSFKFRVEEVSFHHPNQSGFKLKVHHLSSSSFMIHVGLLQVSIVVLSKPKYLPDTSTKIENKKRCLGSYVSLPFDQLVQCFLDEGKKCRCCGKYLSTEEVQIESKHEPSCLFVGDFSFLTNLLNSKLEEPISNLKKTGNSKPVRKKLKKETKFSACPTIITPIQVETKKSTAVISCDSNTPLSRTNYETIITIQKQAIDEQRDIFFSSNSRTNATISSVEAEEEDCKINKYLDTVRTQNLVKTDIPEQVIKRVSLGNEDYHLLSHFPSNKMDDLSGILKTNYADDSNRVSPSNNNLYRAHQFNSEGGSPRSSYLYHNGTRNNNFNSYHKPSQLFNTINPENDLKTVSLVFGDHPTIENFSSECNSRMSVVSNQQVVAIKHSPIKSQQKDRSSESKFTKIEKHVKYQPTSGFSQDSYYAADENAKVFNDLDWVWNENSMTDNSIVGDQFTSPLLP